MIPGRPVAPLPHWQALPAPRRGLEAVVVVPARNEAARIGVALRALAAQCGRDGARLGFHRFEVLVLVNNTDDATAAIARGVGLEHPSLALHVVEARLPPAESNIGFVRRQLMDEALRRLHRAKASPGALIASTDGDSRVAPDWLAQQFVEVAAGADAIGGRIVGDPTEAPPLAVQRAQRRALAHDLLRARLESAWLPDDADPWPRHHQHFGASFAVTARAYADVGGVPSVPFLEDEALARALRGRDWRIRHSPLVRVTTSSRFDGRAEVGFAWQLRQWADGSSPYHDPLVEPVGSWLQFIAALAELKHRREAKQSGDARLDARLGVPMGLSSSLLARGGPFGAMRDAIEQGRRASLDEVDGGLIRLSAAIPELRAAARRLQRRPAPNGAGTAIARTGSPWHRPCQSGSWTRASPGRWPFSPLSSSS